MANRRAKRSEIWVLRIQVEHIWVPLTLLSHSLPLGALTIFVRKYHFHKSASTFMMTFQRNVLYAFSVTEI